jgi:hypothetical protein
VPGVRAAHSASLEHVLANSWHASDGFCGHTRKLPPSVAVSEPAAAFE